MNCQFWSMRLRGRPYQRLIVQTFPKSWIADLDDRQTIITSTHAGIQTDGSGVKGPILRVKSLGKAVEAAADFIDFGGGEIRLPVRVTPIALGSACKCCIREALRRPRAPGESSGRCCQSNSAR